MLPLDTPPPAPQPAFGLPEGIAVLDLTTSIAEPCATMLLADMGARAAKIGRPGHGDDCRAWGPPRLVEHTDAAPRDWLGYDARAISRLRGQKTI